MRDVYIVDGARTPFIKAAGKPNPLPAAQLAVSCGQQLLARQPFLPEQLDEVVVGCVAPSAEEANIGRIIALRLGCGDKVMGWTVARNCASGLQALDCALKDIAIGRHELVLAGGTEAMSRAPLLFNEAATHWFAALSRAKSIGAKLATLIKLRPSFFAPVIAILKGLTDPVVNLNMGQTAEKLAYQFDITRQDMDKFAVQSHQRAALAYDKQLFDEVCPLYDWQGKAFDEDNGLRRDSHVDKLGKLKAVFDKPYGLVTAGNSSQVTDGASMLVLASKDAIQKHKLPVMGRIVDIQWAALDPAVMGLGPAYAIAKLLQSNSLGIKDIDYWEINEAFAAQVIACLKALQNKEFCKTELGLSKPLGEIPIDRLNVDGGAIAIGHPVGASGARIPLHLLHILHREQARYGVASLCIGGGQGGAILVERLEEV